MKYVLFFAASLWFSITATHAQAEYGTPGERAGEMTRRMQEGLSLSLAQADTIHVLNLKYARRIQKEVVDTDMNKLSAYFRIRSINKEKERELLPLLDSRQKEQYEKMKAAATQELLARFF